MNIRGFYWVLLIGLSLTLLFQWTTEKRQEAVTEHLSSVMSSGFSLEDGYASIENDDLVVVVSIPTGNIVESRLKKYPVENVQGSLGYRVFGESKESAFSYYFKSGFTNTSPVYSVRDFGKDYLVLSDDKLGLVKKISFSDSSYELSIYDESLVGVNGKIFAGLYRTEGRALDLKRDALDGGMMNNSSYEGVAISSEQDPYDTSRLSRIDEPKEVLTRSGWVAFVQKYFFAALIGSDEYIYNYYVLPKESGVYRMGYTVESSSTSNLSISHEHRLFVGPKIRKDLMQRADNLELSIDMGWFWFLAQPMVLVMDWINGYINNWGITIVVFTVMIKLLFWPVTAKSFRSMAAMRKITPELNEVKEIYKDDRQKQANETMKLMKKHGANPLGGCLPLLIQMPFFIGFFFALREMVELRHSELGFWADLSAPDPYFVLPALFCLVMILTQRLNPQPAGMDPTQAQVMKYMPVMFSVLFIFFPAALCLYTVVNSAVQLAQQTYLYKQQGALSTD
ncbi:membrane protein insertase YidC [Gammaproteobacteria bacterium]|nr:membrane protein insertase YidC [Gammaproteobacteria bacterium]